MRTSGLKPAQIIHLSTGSLTLWVQVKNLEARIHQSKIKAFTFCVQEIARRTKYCQVCSSTDPLLDATNHLNAKTSLLVALTKWTVYWVRIWGGQTRSTTEILTKGGSIKLFVNEPIGHWSFSTDYNSYDNDNNNMTIMTVVGPIMAIG